MKLPDGWKIVEQWTADDGTLMVRLSVPGIQPWQEEIVNQILSGAKPLTETQQMMVARAREKAYVLDLVLQWYLVNGYEIKTVPHGYEVRPPTTEQDEA